MKKNIVTAEFQFLPNDADELEGLGDAGIETFKDNPLAGLARECGQNSNDAAAGKPVILSFDVLDIARNDIPSVGQLQRAVETCLEETNQKKDEKVHDFFRVANQVLKKPTIKVIRVADKNTTGLIGPCKPGTPFHSLLKSTGVSKKEHDTSGGSFGIGKNATFAVSEVQTVFYSTRYMNEANQQKYLAQGKVRLISHTGSDGKPKRSTGYWGNPEGFLPVTDVKDVPKWMEREEVGTSVFALAFRERPNWEYLIAYSLLSNFFVAVYRKNMRFEVGKKPIVIDDIGLSGLFEDPNVLKAAEEDNRVEGFQFSKDLFRCLISPEAIVKEVTIEGLGRISIRLLIGDDLPKRIAIIRNGMMITDSLEHFGDKFSKFPHCRDFVALIEPLDAEGSAQIKTLENPRHDALSAERIPDPDKKEAAKRAITRLAKAIRSTIKEETSIKHQDEIALDELSEFFSDGQRSTLPPAPEAEEDPNVLRYQRGTSRDSRSASSKVGKAGGGERGKRKGKGDGSRGKSKGRGTGGLGERGQEPFLELNDIRHAKVADGTIGGRSIFFTPTVSGIAKITLEAAGLNDAEKIDVLKSDKGRVVQGAILIPLHENVRTSINVVVADSYEGPVELSAIRIQELPENK